MTFLGKQIIMKEKGQGNKQRSLGNPSYFSIVMRPIILPLSFPWFLAHSQLFFILRIVGISFYFISLLFYHSLIIMFLTVHYFLVCHVSELFRKQTIKKRCRRRVHTWKIIDLHNKRTVIPLETECLFRNFITNRRRKQISFMVIE